MTSLPRYRILKCGQDLSGIQTSGTDKVFQTFEQKPEKPKHDRKAEQASSAGDFPNEALLQEMVQKAEKLLTAAKDEAESIRREAYDAGFAEGREAGHAQGREEGYREAQEAGSEKLRELEERIGRYVADTEIEKEKILEQYLDDLKNISLAIGEKIVQTSLKSSSEVIKRMIIAATEKLKKTAWAKIYVGQTAEGMDIQGDTQLLKELAKLSDNVKIVIMEDAEPGTCVIELPQEIIDISTGAQMENIRDILNNARL